MVDRHRGIRFSDGGGETERAIDGRGTVFIHEDAKNVR